MRLRGRQRGTALLIGVFLIVVIALVGTMIALTSSTQQVSSGRNLDATGAYYAAQARLEREINNVAGTTPGDADCSDVDDGEIKDIGANDQYQTNLLPCGADDFETVEEGGDTYEVFFLRVVAFKGSRSSGTLVRRELEAVVTNKD